MKAKRENGKIIIEISEDAIAEGVHLLPGNAPVKITDRDAFFNFLTEQFCDFGDSGDFNSCSRMTQLIDDLVTHAIECAVGCEC